MGYRPEDLELDEGYWKSLLAEVEGTTGHTQAGPGGVRFGSLAPATLTDANPTAAHEPMPSVRERRLSAPLVDPSDDELPKLWQSLHDALSKNTPLELEVTGVNRGGLIVHYHGLRGFVPSSRLLAVTLDMDEPTRRSTLAEHLGRRLRLRVIELDEAQDRAVFSERVESEPASPGEVTEPPRILQEIQMGETRQGKVTNLTAFGAFVDLGGYEGLVHVSELSWSRVGHPRDILSIGQEVDVYVISADPAQGRIALSLKRAKVDPWHGIEQRFQIGQIVQGVVTNVVQFGAFAKVEDDLEGLIHVSELAEGSFLHPRNIVREGDHIVARVIGVDGHARRLALSLRGVNP